MLPNKVLNLGCLECSDHIHSCGTAGAGSIEIGDELSHSCGCDENGVL